MMRETKKSKLFQDKPYTFNLSPTSTFDKAKKKIDKNGFICRQEQPFMSSWIASFYVHIKNYMQKSSD